MSESQTLIIFGRKEHMLSDNQLLNWIHISTSLANSLYGMSSRSVMNIHLILGILISVGCEVNKGVSESLKNCLD